MLTDRDLLILIPTLGRPEMLEQALASLNREPGLWAAIVIHDGEPVPTARPEGPRIHHWALAERHGYWGALNGALRKSWHELIGFFANDVIFHPGCIAAALACYNRLFPAGLGLLQVQDGVHAMGYHASHGFISRATLDVLYGKPEFPPYDHLFGDGELVQFTKELGLFRSCAEAFIEHLHPDVGKRERDEVDELAGIALDGGPARGREYTNNRYEQWTEAGQWDARRRLAAWERLRI